MMKCFFSTLFKPSAILKKKGILVLIMMLINILPTFAQNVEVKGTVYDSMTKEPLPGVNVILEGTTVGAATDAYGKYSISVPSGNVTLVFSFLGYTTQTVSSQGRALIDVDLVMATTQLEEVVAIGYGSAKKKDITGSVASVKGEALQAIPVSSAVEAISGKMAGVQVTTTEGSPDAEITIRVRGGGSITQDNSPLYIVDGFPVNSINDIPSSSVQSIDVLKDASSTAIYGARGANGVVIITTKSGEEGKVSVSYNAYFGYKKYANKLNTISASDYVKWQYERALLTDELDDRFTPVFGLYQDIDLYDNQPKNDWFEQLFGRTGHTFNHDLTINGGSDKFKYSFGYASLQTKEIMLDSDYKRDNFSLKLDHKPNKKITLSFSGRYSKTKINGGGAIEQSTATPQDARIKQAMLYPSIPINGASSFDFDDEELFGSFVHPIKAVKDNDREQTRTIFNIGTSLAWNVFDYLTLKSEVGLDNYTNLDYQFYGLTTYYVRNTPTATLQNMPAAVLADTKQERFRNTNTINFELNKLIDLPDHNLNLLIGQETLTQNSTTNTETIHGYPTSFTSSDAFKLTTQGTAQSIDNFYNPDDNMLSFFSRLNYNFKERYLLSATFRADGSSKFSKGNRWGYFPSVALAWRISEEEFMNQFSSVLSSLKLRLSYGTAGNNNILSGQLNQAYTSATTTYINGVTSVWIPSTRMANPDLKWETTYTRNIGLDFGLFNGRLNGSAELYLNTTKDLLMEFPVSGIGYSTQFRNMGKTQNKGLELSFDWAAIDKKDYGLSFNFNISFNRNKIKSLGIMEDFGQASTWASTEIGDDYWIAEGHPVGEMYGYIADGRYEVSDFESYDAGSDTWILKAGVADNSAVIGTNALRPGAMKLKNVKDLDTETPGTVNSNDRVVIGNANPKHTGGFTINGRFHGFDLSANFNWSYGNDVYNADKIEFTTARDRYRNMIDVMADGKRWTNIDAAGNLVNDPATLEALNEKTTMWSPYSTRRVFSSWAVEDGSFLRLKTLSLGYTLPNKITNKVKIKSCRIYATVYNVFILTNYSGFDPEVSTRRKSGLTPGVDYSAYPKSRQILFGINLNF
ncbi:MAG: SusC/RagA family TonB-linked outer membrane protein [Bacteroidales bacterium]